MLQNSKIDSQASLLNHTELAAGLSDRQRGELLDRIRQMEIQGYDLDKADGTLELLVREALNPGASPFEVSSFEVTTRSVGPCETQSAARLLSWPMARRSPANRRATAPSTLLTRRCGDASPTCIPTCRGWRCRTTWCTCSSRNFGAASKAAVFIEWSGANRVWTTMGVSG